MMKTRKNGQRSAVAALLVCLAAGVGGCAIGEAAVDGLFAGISNTISTVVSDALLAATPLGGQP